MIGLISFVLAMMFGAAALVVKFRKRKTKLAKPEADTI
jgi:hypothetical protein